MLSFEELHLGDARGDSAQSLHGISRLREASALHQKGGFLV